MRTAYLLHGTCDAHEFYEMDFPSLSNAHWFPWLQQKFLRADYLCQCLEMPRAYAPRYDEWVDTFKSTSLNEDSILVGYSAGAGFLLKYFAENPKLKVAKIFLVAPWLDPLRENGDFLSFTWRMGLRDQFGQVELFYSANDFVLEVKECVETVLKNLPDVGVHFYQDKGHFTFSEIGPQFPELWEAIINDKNSTSFTANASPL